MFRFIKCLNLHHLALSPVVWVWHQFLTEILYNPEDGTIRITLTKLKKNFSHLLPWKVLSTIVTQNGVKQKEVSPHERMFHHLSFRSRSVFRMINSPVNSNGDGCCRVLLWTQGCQHASICGCLQMKHFCRQTNSRIFSLHSMIYWTLKKVSPKCKTALFLIMAIRVLAVK